MRSLLHLGLLATALSPPVLAADWYGQPATFANPPSSDRPLFRYWLPDASVDPKIVQHDVESVASVGGGGLEFVPFFEYGGGHVGSMPPGANWERYNFGTPAFQNVFRAALEAHAEHGMLMDFAFGPNQGQGVPADVSEDGLQMDLVPFTAKVPDSGIFDGEIPGWGTGELVAFTSALVVSQESHTFEVRDNFDLKNVTYDQYWLRHSSLADQTRHVSRHDGHAMVTFPNASPGTYHRVFSFFQKKTLHKNLEFKPSASMNDTIFRNGSYAVDHFSAHGAEAVARFWEKYILTNGVADRLIKAGGCGWEDSLEVASNISWSQSIPGRFKCKFGISINPFLPLFAFKQNNAILQPASPGKFECTLDNREEMERRLNQFHQVLGEGYAEYLDALRRWLRERLGKDLSVQPAYNFPVDMLAAIPHVDIPECESFGFQDNIDLYRRFVGPAQLTGKRIISNEMGAVPNQAYRYPVSHLLFSINRAFAAGVNRFVLHGGAYTGNYYATTWPGHTGFAYLFSDPWSEKQPVWNHGLKEVFDYVARVSHVLRQGVPKIDIIRYSKQSTTTIVAGTEPVDLVDGGWSYTYLSSDNLGLDEPKVKNAHLAPNGPEWQAMVVEESENLTLSAVASLKRYASEGFPIIFSGGSPGFYPIGNDTEEKFHRELRGLQRLRSVYHVANKKVAEKLTSIGLSPRVGVKTNGTWYTTWYDAGDVGYAVVFSDMVKASGQLIVNSTQSPYFYDAWTGDRSPVLAYTQNGGKAIIPLDLAGNQTVIIAFSDSLSKSVPTPRHVIISAPPNVIGTEVGTHLEAVLHVAYAKGIQTVRLDNGKTVGVHGDAVAPAFPLSNWTLVAEHWEAPENLYDASVIARKRNTTHALQELVSWDRLPTLANVSGLGYYSTSFDWCSSKGCLKGQADGAYLNLGRITEAARVFVNGKQTPPLDLLKPDIDISRYLKVGKNEVQIVVPTVMWNYLRGLLPKLKTAGSTPFPLSMKDPLLAVEAGLVGTVTVTPYVLTQVS
ncbi:hypothetical protein BJY00DRAFT_306805 [Aspergillus carlsbadensis]|nr:hypothetical protein BJY00DRAFT_306805 [Aspergillus carlsbadensis]